MGTSAGYSLPTGGNWSKLKRDVTRWISTGDPDVQSAGQVIDSYAQAHRSASNATQQRAQIAKVGARFAEFVSEVAQNGLAETLTQNSLGQLIGRTASEVLQGIRDYLIGDGSLLEDDVVQHAFVDFYEEQLLSEATFEGLEQTLQQENVADMTLRFFGYCIYRQFLTEFHERMLKLVDIPTAQQYLATIKDYIFTKLQVLAHNKDTSIADWAGAAGETLAGQILKSAWDFLELNHAS